MDYIYLQHHGVIGMKWGVRRYQNKDGSLTSAGKKRRSVTEVVKDVREARKQKLAKDAEEQRKRDIQDGKIKSKDMTEAELKSRIERLKLEQSYNQAMTQNKAAVSRGEKILDQYVGPAAKKIIWDTSVDVTAQATKHAFVKAVNKAIGEDVTFTNNKKKS